MTHRIWKPDSEIADYGDDTCRSESESEVRSSIRDRIVNTVSSRLDELNHTEFTDENCKKGIVLSVLVSAITVIILAVAPSPKEGMSVLMYISDGTHPDPDFLIIGFVYFTCAGLLLRALTKVVRNF